MAKAVIITDTSSDLPEDIKRNYPIKILQMVVSSKDKPEMDISNISLKVFYDLMRKGDLMPTISQVTVNTYMQVFEECLEEGMVPIVLGLSSKLTCSYESAVLAKKNLNADDIIVIDSKCASFGLGLVVYRAAKMAKEGVDPKDIAEDARFYCEHMEHIFTVDSLDHLKRGGRISAAQAFVGGLLNIKPVLHFVDGAILPLEKVRGRKNVVKKMVQIMGERGVNLDKQLVGISHGDNEELALELADAIKKEFNVKEIMMSGIGPVIGAHSGPGTVALFFQNA